MERYWDDLTGRQKVDPMDMQMDKSRVCSMVGQMELRMVESKVYWMAGLME